MELTNGLMFTSKWFVGLCTILSIDEPNNELVVHINRETGNHNEDWNLQHTLWGFENDDYKLYLK
jgi:hypothetical protein